MGTRDELLSYLWTNVIETLSSDSSLDNAIAHCKRVPHGPFSDVGPAIERMLDAGVSRHDLRIVLRATAYEAVFGTLYALDDPGVDDNNVFMLHEELLLAEPRKTAGEASDTP